MKINNKNKSQIVLLGTGTPNPDPERSGNSVAIVVNDTPYIVDCGPGLVRRSAEAFNNGIKGLAISKLSRLFITHLHSDHTIGLPDIIFTPWVLERKEPLKIYGPSGIKNMTSHILAAYSEDIRERKEGLEPANDKGDKADVIEVKPGIIYEDDNVKVEALKMNHGSWDSYAYKFYTPDRIIIVSGDTAPFEGIEETYEGCNVLVHEVQSAEGLKTRNPEWKKYHSNVHTTTYELTEIANKVKPDLLILYHQLFHGANEQSIIDEMSGKYFGKFVSGKDLDVF
jgi:ribonuclease BN (tRNA processing enzyme)